MPSSRPSSGCSTRPRWAHAAIRAIQYERHKGGPRPGTWWDFRVPELARERAGSKAFANLLSSPGRLQAVVQSGATSVSLWCHGSPGIALSRMRAFSLEVDREACRLEAQDALVATEQSVLHTTLHSHCLCHGLFGNAETLRLARMIGISDYDATVGTVALRAIDTNGDGTAPWPSGGPGKVPDPSLMLGDAGIGLFLMNLAEGTPTSVLCPSAWDELLSPEHPDLEDQLRAFRIKETQEKLPTFLRVLARFDDEARLTNLLETSMGESPTVEASLELLESELRNLPDSPLRLQLLDALLPEVELQREEAKFDDFVLQAIQEVRLDRTRESDWDRDAFCLAAHVRLLTSTWAWQKWLGEHPEPPSQTPEFVVLCRQGRTVRLFQLRRLSGVVFDAISVSPMPLRQIVEVLNTRVQADGLIGDAWIPRIKEAIREGVRAGIVAVIDETNRG